MEEDDEDPEQGGDESAGVLILLLICSTVYVTTRCINMGGYPRMGQFLWDLLDEVVWRLAERLTQRRSDRR